jgi:hypothetical protein
MKLQIQPNLWSCMPVALAMILDEDFREIIEEIGHDGSEIIKTDQLEPCNRRGFHPQELAKICYSRSKALIQFDIIPSVYFNNITYIYGDDKKYIDKLMRCNEGILLGTINGKDHGVAWDKEKIYDPNGTIYAKGFFGIETFLLVRDLL